MLDCLAMFTVALISRKGGAGKTTLACGLAVASEQEGLVTALVDLDPQGSASAWASLRISDTPAVISGSLHWWTLIRRVRPRRGPASASRGPTTHPTHCST